MSDDQIFRLILLGAFVVVLPIGAYYRIRSWSTGEKLDRQQEGLFILSTLRPIAAVGLLAIFAFIANPEWMRWSAVPLPVWLRWIGVGVGIPAASLLIWTFHTLGMNLTDTVVTRKAHTLVTTGPYRWVRHPFYVAFALAMVANGLVTANWFVVLTGAAAFSLIVLRTRKEEQNLLARFGEEYRDYMRRTGRFVPRFMS